MFLSYSEVTVTTRSGPYPAQMVTAVTRSSPYPDQMRDQHLRDNLYSPYSLERQRSLGQLNEPPETDAQ